MKKPLLALLLFNLCCFTYLSAQDLINFNQTRLKKQKTSMLVLGTWAVGNIAVGTTLGATTSGERQYFNYMNAGWNLVNLGLATVGYWTATKADPASFDLYQSIQEHHSTQKIFLFNAGLDVGYMAGGLYLMERAKNTENNPARLRGFGKSILLQGGFLFVFDLAAYWWQSKGNGDIVPLLEGLSFNGSSIGWRLQF
jgi:hypothetical protein